MVVKYGNRDSLKDNRQFKFGEIWKIRDELIRLLPTDRVDRCRTVHNSRPVIILDNCLQNNDEESLLIRVAPLASDISFQGSFDIILEPSCDGVNRKCMVQIQLAQPILKKDLYEKIGDISDGKKEEIAALLMYSIGINLESI